MPRRLDLPERQVTALCRGAAKAGYAPVIQVGNVWVRLVPEKHAIPPQPNDHLDEDEDIRL